MLKNKIQGDISERCQFLLGLCFNPASMQNAEEAGMDAERFRADAEAWIRPRLARIPTREDMLPADPDWIADAFQGRLRQYVDALNDCTTRLWLRVAEIVKQGGGKVQMDYLADGVRTDVNGLDRSAIVGAVEKPVGQPNQDALSRSRMDQGVGAVLHQLVELPVGVAAAGCVVFLIGMLRNEARLLTMKAEFC